jgi:hypothetical protein
MSLQFLKTLTIHARRYLEELGLFPYYPAGVELILGNINPDKTIKAAF